MTKILKAQPKRKRRESRKALHIWRRLQNECSADERFRGMTEEEIIQQIKKSREEIWQEKLAYRS